MYNDTCNPSYIFFWNGELCQMELQNEWVALLHFSLQKIDFKKFHGFPENLLFWNWRWSKNALQKQNNENKKNKE